MPSVTLETTHSLGQEEATRRLKERFSSLIDEHQDRISNLRQQWDENAFSFGFEAVGMKIAGTVTVEPSAVKLAAEVPLAAMLFKSRIEEHVHKELGELLG